VLERQLELAAHADNKLVTSYMHDVCHCLLQCDLLFDTTVFYDCTFDVPLRVLPLNPGIWGP
ncbi:MAG: hypothetical protein ACK53Y_00325, partial [bacterium]